jgi:hypothetical protein
VGFFEVEVWACDSEWNYVSVPVFVAGSGVAVESEAPVLAVAVVSEAPAFGVAAFGVAVPQGAEPE